jgi:uncharacterized protein YndB with AHSA1/START domain
MVTTTKQEWVVESVELKGILPYVHVRREAVESVVPPERLSLFDVYTSEIPVVTAPAPDGAVTALHEAVAQTTVELTLEDSEKLKKRIEENFTSEPELQKPARKPRSKKKDE